MRTRTACKRRCASAASGGRLTTGDLIAAVASARARYSQHHTRMNNATRRCAMPVRTSRLHATERVGVAFDRDDGALQRFAERVSIQRAHANHTNAHTHAPAVSHNKQANSDESVSQSCLDGSFSKPGTVGQSTSNAAPIVAADNRPFRQV